MPPVGLLFIVVALIGAVLGSVILFKNRSAYKALEAKKKELESASIPEAPSKEQELFAEKYLRESRESLGMKPLDWRVPPVLHHTSVHNRSIPWKWHDYSARLQVDYDSNLRSQQEEILRRTKELLLASAPTKIAISRLDAEKFGLNFEAVEALLSPQPAFPTTPIEFPVNDEEIRNKFQENLTTVFAERAGDLDPLLSKLQELWYRAFAVKESDFQTHLEEVFQNKAHSMSSTLQGSLNELWDLGVLSGDQEKKIPPDVFHRAKMCVQIAVAEGRDSGEQAEARAMELMALKDDQLKPMALEFGIEGLPQEEQPTT